jgi:hypothetical protein
MAIRDCETYPDVGHELVWQGEPMEADSILCYVEGIYRMRKGSRKDGRTSIQCEHEGRIFYLIVDQSCPALALKDPNFGDPKEDGMQANCYFYIGKTLLSIASEYCSFRVLKGCTVNTGDVLWNEYGDEYWDMWSRDDPQLLIADEGETGDPKVPSSSSSSEGDDVDNRSEDSDECSVSDAKVDSD